MNPLRLSPHHPVRKLLGVLIVTLLATTAALLMRMPPMAVVTRAADLLIYDLLWRTRGQEDMRGGAVAIVRIADEDLKLMRQGYGTGDPIGYPWPREFWGRLVEYLGAAGVKAVAFDLQFSEPSVYNATSDDDETFATRVAGAGVPVAFAAKLDGEAVEALAVPVEKPRLGVVTIKQGALLREYTPRPGGSDSLATAVLGSIKAEPPEWAGASEPYLVHWYGPSLSERGNTFRYVSAAAHVHAAVKWTKQQDDARAAAESEGRAPPPPPPLIPDDARTREELAGLKGKIVLVGAVSAGTFDLFSTPLSPLFPGVELHATAIENMLRDQRVMVTPPWAVLLAIVSTAAATAAVTIFAMGTWLRLAAGAIVLSLLTAAAVVHFGGAQVDWLPLAAPLVAGFLGIAGGFGRNYLTEDARRRLMTRALGQYVSPEVTRVIERNPDQLKLDAQQRTMTVLFSDMAGFTDFSEAADIRVLTRVLNVYMERMSAVVLEQGGTIDKYIGDAVMAFWNAPLEQPDHAARACRTALRMREAEAEIREELLRDAELTVLLKEDARTAGAIAAMGRTALYTRIGINTGPMNVGNWGSARKFQYTVIGDAVNSGARLEPANKRYGTRMLISGTTAALVRDQFLLRRVDVTRVKGKAQAMEVFEVIAEGQGTPQQRELVAAYEAAFDLYCRREWPEALERLAAMEGRFGADGPARMLAERISTLLAQPHVEWDGVYTATDK